MSHPADTTPPSERPDPFDELARLINGPVETDFDAQAIMEGRANVSAARPPVATAAPVEPVEAIGAVQPAPLPNGIHAVPTRGPLARVAQPAAPRLAPAADATDDASVDNEIEAIFDLSALRAAFAQPQGPVEPVPTSEVVAAPTPIEAAPAAEAQPPAEVRPAVAPGAEPELAAEPAPIAFAEPAVSAPAFDVTAMPVASVPATETAEIVAPPLDFAEAGDVEPEFEPDLVADMLAAMSESAAAEQAPAPAAAMPEASFDMALEDELEAALVDELQLDIDERAFAAPQTDAPASDAPIMLEPTVQPDVDFAPEPVAPVQARRAVAKRRGAMVMASVCILGAASAGGWMLLDGADGAAEAPVILADAAPVRARPAEAGGVVVPNQDTALFKDDTDTQAALRTGTEEPVEVAVRPVKVRTSVRETVPAAARRVRTVVVKPDGTIVRGSDVVGAVPPRVAKVEPRTQPKAMPLPKPVAPDLDAPAPTIAELKAKLKRPSEPIVTKVATVPVSQANEKAALPKPIKAEGAAKPKPAPVEVAKVEPAAKPVLAPEPAAAPKPAAPKPAAAPKHDGYVVQISSRRSPEGARKAWGKLQKRYRSVLGERTAQYQETQIAGKGTFYRVRVPAESKKDASRLCSKLKRAGGSCFVTR